jgi:hypothetical protein
MHLKSGRIALLEPVRIQSEYTPWCIRKRRSVFVFVLYFASTLAVSNTIFMFVSYFESSPPTKMMQDVNFVYTPVLLTTSLLP